MVVDGMVTKWGEVVTSLSKEQKEILKLYFSRILELIVIIRFQVGMWELLDCP